MLMHKNEKLIDSIRPNLKVKPAEYANLTFQTLSEKIADDYEVIIKTCVVPSITSSSGLKMREIRVMACLGLYDIPLTPAHIAALLCYDPSTVTRAVSCLIEAGMVSRSENIHDTRSVILSLTEKGSSLAALYIQRVKTTFETLETMIGTSLSEEEKTQYLSILYKISNRAAHMRYYSKHLPRLSETLNHAVAPASDL